MLQVVGDAMELPLVRKEAVRVLKEAVSQPNGEAALKALRPILE